MTPEARALAHLVIQLRRALIMGRVARLKDSPGDADRWERVYVHFWFQLPTVIRIRHRKYIVEPAMNQLAREGVLRQNGRYKLPNLS